LISVCGPHGLTAVPILTLWMSQIKFPLHNELSKCLYVYM